MPHLVIKNSQPFTAELRVADKIKPAAIDHSRPQIAFLTRKNPQTIGGVQRLTARTIEALSSKYDIDKISWTGPEWGAPFYFPLFYRKTGRSPAVLAHCDDAVTALVGTRIKEKLGKKVTAAVHGLDVILPIAWYQRRISRALRTLDKVVCASRATAERVRERGVESGKIVVVNPPADDVPECPPLTDGQYDYIARKIGVDLRGRTMLLSVGRTVKRKGFDCFIKDVFLNLPENYIYIVAGTRPPVPPWIKYLKPLLGPRLHHLLMLASGCYSLHDDLVRASGHSRIFYINGASTELRDLLYRAGDLFIMPNRTVPGDMEGFGIVALEAAVRGLPVVATGIEGITDAVIDGENGYCVPEGDSAAMKKTIESLVDDKANLKALGRKAREFTRRAFDSSLVAAKYDRIFHELLLAKKDDRA